MNSVATVQDVFIPPTDRETDIQFKERIIALYNTQPQGGSPADYALWSLDVINVGEAAIRKTYAYGGTGTVGAIGDLLLFVENASTDNLPKLPSQGQLDSIYTDNVPPTAGEPIVRQGVAVFDPDTTKPDSERGRMPVPGPFSVTIAGVTIEIVTLTITDLIVNSGENPTTVQNQINAALIASTFNVRPFVSGADDPNSQSDILSDSELSAVAINTLFGRQTFRSLTISLDGGSTFIDSKQYTFGEVPQLDIIYLTS